jgi:hypothetical protein
MKRSLRLFKRRSVMTALGVPLLVVLMAGPAAADVTGVSGSAFGESVDVTLASVHVTSGPLPTVTLPSSGGNLSDSAASVEVPSGCSTTSTCLLKAGLLQVHTEGTTGATGSAHSTADVASLIVNQANPVVTADAVHSECTSNSDGSTGSTTLVHAFVNGVTDVSGTPGPNTVIAITVAGISGTVTLNEQTVSNSSGSTSITVNAIHVHLEGGSLGSGDIIISQSHCDADGTIVAIPVGTIGGLLLAGVVGVVFLYQVRRRRSSGNAVN